MDDWTLQNLKQKGEIVVELCQSRVKKTLHNHELAPIVELGLYIS